MAALLRDASQMCGRACMACRQRGTGWWNEDLRKLVDKRGLWKKINLLENIDE